MSLSGSAVHREIQDAVRNFQRHGERQAYKFCADLISQRLADARKLPGDQVLDAEGLISELDSILRAIESREGK